MDRVYRNPHAACADGRPNKPTELLTCLVSSYNRQAPIAVLFTLGQKFQPQIEGRSVDSILLF